MSNIEVIPLSLTHPVDSGFVDLTALASRLLGILALFDSHLIFRISSLTHPEYSGFVEIAAIACLSANSYCSVRIFQFPATSNIASRRLCSCFVS